MDIRIRQNRFTTSATVYVAAGYDAIGIERRIRGLPPISSSTGSSIQQPAFQKIRVPSYEVRSTNWPQPDSTKPGPLVHKKPDIVDLTAEDSDTDPDTVVGTVGQDENLPMETTDDPPVRVESRSSPLGDLSSSRPDPTSPALTIEGITENEPRIEDQGDIRPDQRYNDNKSSPRNGDELEGLEFAKSTAGDDTGSSSSSDSEDDGPVVAPAIGLPEEDHLTQVLHAPIRYVKQLIQDTPNTQRHERDWRLSRRGESSSGASGESQNHSEGDESGSESASHTRRVGDERQPRRPATGHIVSPGPPRVSGNPLRLAMTSRDGGPAVSVRIPKSDSVKARRLLVPGDTTTPITAVGMRGDVQFIHQAQRYVNTAYIRSISHCIQQSSYRTVFSTGRKIPTENAVCDE